MLLIYICRYVDMRCEKIGDGEQQAMGVGSMSLRGGEKHPWTMA
jgi:hypothetical protein